MAIGGSDGLTGVIWELLTCLVRAGSRRGGLYRYRGFGGKNLGGGRLDGRELRDSEMFFFFGGSAKRSFSFLVVRQKEVPRAVVFCFTEKLPCYDSVWKITPSLNKMILFCLKIIKLSL